MDSRQIQKSYELWRAKYYPMADLDDRLEPFLAQEIHPESSAKVCWLRAVREAFFLSTESMSQKLNVSRSAYWKMEQAEEKGTITLNALAKAAKAMDCELVYAIRPKTKKRFSEVIWKTLQEKAIQHHWVRSRPEMRKVAALAFIAREYMVNTRFRRAQQWSERIPNDKFADEGRLELW